MMNNCIIYTKSQLIGIMVQINKGTKTPKPLMDHSKNHDFIFALCLGDLKEQSFLKIHVTVIHFFV